jgi:dihydroorotase
VIPLLIKGGRVIDPSRKTDGIADLLVVDGKVAAVGTNIGTPDGAQVHDAKGMVVAPGLIDVHVHLREPGFEDLETIATGAAAAVAGGFTGVCAMPNTDPVIDNQSAVGFVLSQGKKAGKARVYPIGCITIGQKGERLAEFGEMVGAGAVAVSDDGKPVQSSHMMRTALEYAKIFGIPVADHCEDVSLAHGGAMHEGIVSMRLGLKGIPAAAEEIQVARDCILAELTGGHIHLCHMSTRGSVELIRRAKEKGLRVTAEAAPHHFTLTQERVEGYDTNAKMNPPLREEADREAIRQAVKDGTIDCIATDHAPHARDEKEVPFEQAPMGTTGLETAFAAVYTELVQPGVLSLELIVEKLTCGGEPFGIPAPRIAKGARANLTLVDLAAEWEVGASGYESRSANCCFDGRLLHGKVGLTLAAGSVAYRTRVLEVVG